MRSTRGLVASITFLLALPLTAVYQMLFGTGVEAVIHGVLALGSALMSLAVFDFKTPRWATWMGSVSTGVLATVFFLQGLSEVTHDAALTHLAYRVLGQRLEGRLVDLFMVWCVVVLVVDKQATRRTLGIVAMATVACVKAYSLGLAYQGTSLDAEAPLLKILWLMPFVWILLESATSRRLRRVASPTVTPIRATDEAILPFPPADVWRVLADLGAYPGWWPRHLGLRVLHHEAGLVGSEVEQRPFGGRAFRCRVEAVEEPHRIRTRYYGGFIEGQGEWRLEPVGSGTRACYELDVRAEGRLVACLGWILPLGRLHSRQMQGVFRQLERVLLRRRQGGEGR